MIVIVIPVILMIYSDTAIGILNNTIYIILYTVLYNLLNYATVLVVVLPLYQYYYYMIKFIVLPEPEVINSKTQLQLKYMHNVSRM